MDPNSSSKKNGNISRRKFLKNSVALTGASLLAPLSIGASAYAGGSDKLKLALIGSGGRGTGAVVDALQADDSVELIAIADVFKDMVDRSYKALVADESRRKQINVPEEHKFAGLDAYKHAIALADVAILATPPAFRPLHFEAAVNAGKHVFMEKPLATDAPGIRRILAAGKQAEQRGLSVVAGHQYRYARLFQKLMDRIHRGTIGEVRSMTCNYLLAGISIIPRQEGQTELEYQLRNWRCFEWLWGGSPAGLTIHFEDIAHWAKGSYPIRAFGTGGRAALKGPEHGNIYDHYYIDYEYEDGTRLHSRTRHIPGCWTNRSLSFVGSDGTANLTAGTDTEIKNLQGELIWSHQATEDPDPYQTEHEVLFKAIRSEEPVNDTEWAALSSMTSIMGRMAVQSGKLIEWDDAFNSDLVLVPDDLSFDSQPPVLPKENGYYPVPEPGGEIKVL
ncbi:MAG: Gfo/Idh/MocA family protein [Balneolaceae bacterium]